MAFTVKDSNGMQHLKALADAGLTHVHLLPAFDIASVDENPSKWKSVDANLLKTYGPDSELQSQAVAQIKAQDGFNWGYDPYHYTAPEAATPPIPLGMSVSANSERWCKP